MADTILRACIALRYDTLENWSTNNAQNIILQRGEVAVVQMPSELNESPSIRMKVGDGHTIFNNLPWLQANAADVSSWAKSENKPTYSANEIVDLQSFIEDFGGGASTQYRIVTVIDDQSEITGYKLQYKSGGTWEDVENTPLINVQTSSELNDLITIQLENYGFGDVVTHNVSEFAMATDLSTAISDLVGNAPQTLNTLNELASAVGNDPNFSHTVSEQLNNKIENIISTNLNIVTRDDNSVVVDLYWNEF